LAQLKKGVSKLERKISIKIQENQMKQQNATDENTVEEKTTPVFKKGKPLFPKRQIANEKI
jgi:hypothetical protein